MKAKLLVPNSINYYHSQHKVLFDLIGSSGRQRSKQTNQKHLSKCEI
jgi:hypothetical protein